MILERWESTPASGDNDGVSAIFCNGKIVTFASPEIATHIVELHNRWNRSHVSPSAFQLAMEVIDGLPGLVKTIRDKRGISMREAAVEIGISPASVYHLEHGKTMNASIIRAFLEWVRREMKA